MRIHKRKKSSRIKGSKTAGWGFRQKHKGHGNRGGVGMAGSGKRADHKKQVALESDKKKRYFGKQGLTSRKAKKKGVDCINLADVKANFKSAKDNQRLTIEKTKGLLKIDLSKYKILAKGEGFKAEILAKAASVGAVEKMEKAGGKIVLVGKKEESNIENQTEK